jgi:hypothetical protein
MKGALGSTVERMDRRIFPLTPNGRMTVSPEPEEQRLTRTMQQLLNYAQSVSLKDSSFS